MLTEYKTKPFAQLAADAFAEFLARVGDDFDEYDEAMEAEQLSAIVIEPDAAKRAAKLKYAARSLAKMCKQRDFVALGPLPLPVSMEDAAALQNGNIHMRIIRAWDVMQSAIVIRLDVIGYRIPDDTITITPRKR